MCGLCILTAKHGGKMIQVERQDGKTIEFNAPLLVEEILERLPGTAGVVLSNKTHHLPLKYKLKMGKMYYLAPKSSRQGEPTVVKKEDEALGRCGSKRIKVVITKQQLQQLVSNQISIQEVMMGGKQTEHPCWKSELESIPEEGGE